MSAVVRKTGRMIEAREWINSWKESLLAIASGG